MDVVTGMAALAQAIGIAKDLREIGRTYDEATFKLKFSELQSALADAKVALSDAKIELSRKSEEISDLEGQIDLLKYGEFCPKCRTGRMNLVSTEPQTMYGLNHLGVEVWQYECDGCAFVQHRIHDPHGVVPAQAKKR